MSNNLSRNSAKMVTFGTLVDSLRLAFPGLDEESYSAVLEYLVQFVAELSRIRPKEIALLSVGQRRTVRDTSVADKASLWQAYIRLAAWLREQKKQNWKDRPKVLGEPYVHGQNGKTQRFDLFSRENPIWLERGILAPGKKGLRVVNNRPSRQAAFETLKDLI